MLRYKILYDKKTGKPIHAQVDGKQAIWGKKEVEGDVFGFCFADLEKEPTGNELRSRHIISNGKLVLLEKEEDWEENKIKKRVAMEEIKDVLFKNVFEDDTSRKQSIPTDLQKYVPEMGEKLSAYLMQLEAENGK